MSARGRRGGARAHIWAAIREMREFTLLDLTGKTGDPEETVADYLKGLRRAGFVENAGSIRSFGGGGGRALYRLIHDPGVDAPRVRRDGTILPEAGRDRLWRCMRILRDFSITDLVVQASLPEAPVAAGEAEFYCLYLARAGYLVEIEPNRRFRFLPSFYTGPRAPMIRRVREVVDGNTGEVRWSGDEREERP